MHGWVCGDEVFGMTGGVGDVQGSLAEYAAVDARLITRKPAALTFREVAAPPLVLITAWEGLVGLLLPPAVIAGAQAARQSASGSAPWTVARSASPFTNRIISFRSGDIQRSSPRGGM